MRHVGHLTLRHYQGLRLAQVVRWALHELFCEVLPGSAGAQAHHLRSAATSLCARLFRRTHLKNLIAILEVLIERGIVSLLCHDSLAIKQAFRKSMVFPLNPLRLLLAHSEIQTGWLVDAALRS